MPHFGNDGEVLGFFALLQDITERKKAAQELQEAKESLEVRVAARELEGRLGSGLPVTRGCG